jgi:hypothetical protein
MFVGDCNNAFPNKFSTVQDFKYYSVFLIISVRIRILWLSDLCIVANLRQNETYSCEKSVRFAPLH